MKILTVTGIGEAKMKKLRRKLAWYGCDRSTLPPLDPGATENHCDPLSLPGTPYWADAIEGKEVIYGLFCTETLEDSPNGKNWKETVLGIAIVPKGGNDREVLERIAKHYKEVARLVAIGAIIPYDEDENRKWRQRLGKKNVPVPSSVFSLEVAGLSQGAMAAGVADDDVVLHGDV